MNLRCFGTFVNTVFENYMIMYLFKGKEFMPIWAQIFRSSKRVFDCKILETSTIISATALREIVKKSHPVVGDFVELKLNDSNEYEIIGLKERENSIFRRIVRTNKTKYVAANVDVILIVASVSKPEYKTFLIDRYLLRATQWEIPVVVVYNKMDQFDDQFDLEFEQYKHQSLGVTTFQISSIEGCGEKFQDNLKKLQDLLKDKTAICLGQSGVGKSQLITKLSNGEVELLSSRLSKKVDKGAHTTTWAEIVDLKDFKIIDSPGIRSLSIQDISVNELDDLFPDLSRYFNRCQFNDCKHELNSKGCSFRELDEEKIEDLVVLERLTSYLKIRDEVDSIPQWEK